MWRIFQALHERMRGGSGFSVAASPFNGVKLELSLGLLFGVGLAAILHAQAVAVMFPVMTIYALSLACWVTLRARAVLQRQIRNG